MTENNDEVLMKRRLVIYEKIKFSKLNKLTIKQGDLNVKLVLKKDLLDKNVEIPEKVLCMLEAYEVKNTKTNDSNECLTSNSQTISTDLQAPFSTSNQAIDSNTNYETLINSQFVSNKSILSPSAKKVRFDLNTSLSPISSTFDTNNLFGSKTNNSSIIMTKHPSKEQLQADKIHSLEEIKSNLKNQSEQHVCRLCRLKCSNEKALYEHVARLHGGKGVGASNNNYSHPSSDQDDEYAGSDDEFNVDNEQYMEGEEEFEDDQDSYLSSNSDLATSTTGPFRKRKIVSSSRKFENKNAISKPNLAIRVAKAAYYNSKDSLDSIQSNAIFTNGIRGNFFSQERLPLRSCKIKMKLAHHLNEHNSNYDANNFLSNTIEITKFNYLNKNTTQTIQSIKNNEQELLLTETEIKNFFKSLIIYIPNNVIRLEDLIKQNESFLKEIDINSFKCIRTAHEVIVDAKQFGITLSNLKIQIQDKINQKVTLNSIIRLLNILLENCLVLSVGVVERVYVAHEFKQHWVIQSFKNQKGVGVYMNENSAQLDYESPPFDESELEDKLLNENDTDKATASSMESTERRVTRKKSQLLDESQNENDSLAKKFKSVCLIPRPWRYIDGVLNRPVLKQMLETIILHLKTYPNSTFEALSAHFSPILQPIMTLELIEMLEMLKCVKKFTLKKETKCDLFSDFNNGSFKFNRDHEENENDLNGDETCTYYCSQNSIFTIKKVFPD